MKNINDLYILHINTMQKRTKKILKYSKSDAIIIHSGEPIRIYLENTYYPFKVNHYFRAWVPIIDVPHSWLLIDGVNTPRLYLYSPDEYWVHVDDFSNKFWINIIDLIYLKDINNIYKILSFLPKKKLIYIGHVIDKAKTLGILLQNINPKKILNFYDFYCLYKTEYELYCMRESQKIAIRGHLAAFNAFKVGMSEFDINISYLQATKQRDINTPYTNIIALNKNTAILHYNKLQQAIPNNIYNFLIDAGAMFNGYIADITRSYVVDNKNEFHELISEINTEQLSLIKTMKPNVPHIDYSLKMFYKIAEILIKHKFIKNISVEAAVKTGLINMFLPHNLIHSIGLQVHDLIIQFKNKKIDDSKTNFVLKPKMVLAIEPGIYFIESLFSKFRFGKFSKYFNWNKIDFFKFYGGIRIEDNIVIHNNYIENMTRDLNLV
ncbi:Xaa-Pro dipeptidase [Candidatus Providencia siddallii]|uniref:Xaa-Pro dipeptidase n=1 Tax=Candidatus Providencia siddallii TaxID=1715285 RepID=A0A0M6W989_9GAMM|nr:Xaa-Pro dipeptidase [Candidatus Providencia siddallii]